MSSSNGANNQEVVITDADLDLLFHQPPPPSYALRPLNAPLVVPQDVPKFDAPFVRAYAPDAIPSGVDRDEWLSFVDGLNMAMTTSPPLRVVDTAGKILGFIPYHWTMIAGIGMQVGAQTAARKISKSLTDKYLRRANETYFAPRGLRVRLVKTAAMRVLVGLDEAPTSDPSKASSFAKGVGRTAENLALRSPFPFGKRIIEAVKEPVPALPAGARSEDASLRRLASLGNAVLPLEFDVPEPVTPQGLADRFANLGVKLDRMQKQKADRQADRNRKMLAVVENRDQPQAQQASSSSSRGGLIGRGPVRSLIAGRSGGDNGGERKFRGGPISGLVIGLVQAAMSKKDGKSNGNGNGNGNGAAADNSREALRDRRAERRARHIAERGGFRARNLKSRVAAADRLEYNATEQLVWIVVLNADQDAMIQGRELVDSKEDYETVDREDWEVEMDMEEEEEEVMARSNAQATNGQVKRAY